jgi:hypothetical protein
MIVNYEFCHKGKWTKELAVFDTKEQADNFISILKNSEDYRNFEKIKKVGDK